MITGRVNARKETLGEIARSYNVSGMRRGNKMKRLVWSAALCGFFIKRSGP